MRAVEAVIKVSPDGTAVLRTANPLRPGQHKILIIADEAAIPEEGKITGEVKRSLDLRPISPMGWPKDSTFRREEIYNDDGR